MSGDQSFCIKAYSMHVLTAYRQFTSLWNSRKPPASRYWNSRGRFIFSPRFVWTSNCNCPIMLSLSSDSSVNMVHSAPSMSIYVMHWHEVQLDMRFYSIKIAKNLTFKISICLCPSSFIIEVTLLCGGTTLTLSFVPMNISCTWIDPFWSCSFENHWDNWFGFSFLSNVCISQCGAARRGFHFENCWSKNIYYISYGISPLRRRSFSNAMLPELPKE